MSGISPSKNYSVKVNEIESFTYEVKGWGDYGYGDFNSWETVSWTSFTIPKESKSVTVEITADLKTIKSAVIRPLSKGIVPIVKGNKLTLEIDSPCKISVEIDGKYETDKLFIFADEPEINPPRKDDSSVTCIEPGAYEMKKIGPGVIFFDAGVYNLPENIEIASNTTLYFARGSFVNGTFRGKNLKNVKFTGRGILCGTGFEHRDGAGLIKIGASDSVIEGITLLDSPGWNIAIGASRKKEAKAANNVINNIKIIGMRLNADGIGASGIGVEISDIFVFSYDDAIDVGQGIYDATISNCVLYMRKASALKISWNSYGCGNVRVKDITVIHYDTDSDYMENECVIFANHSTPGTVRDILMENITVEAMNGKNKRFLGMWIRTSQWDPEPDLFGNIREITFRNLNVMCQTYGNHICGLDSEHTIENIKFENLTIKGKHINSAEEADIYLNEFAGGVSFG